MSATRLIALLLTGATLMLVGSASAQGAGASGSSRSKASGVGELWDEFPLEDGRPLRGSRAVPTTDADGRVKPRAKRRLPPASRSSTTAAPTPSSSAARKPPTTPASDDGASGVGKVWVGGLIALLLVVDVLVFLRIRTTRRRRRRAAAYPVWGPTSNVYAQGSTERDGIGAFQGFVYAMGSDAGPDADRMLCVHDPSRDEPLWVRRSEVASLSRGEGRRSVEVADPSPKQAARASSA